MASETVEVVLDGKSTQLTYDSVTGLYTGEVKAPESSSYHVNADHYYPVSIRVIDNAGNERIISDSDSDYGEILRLSVLDITAPVITLISPPNKGIVNGTLINSVWQVTDDDSGVNPDTVTVQIDNGPAIKNNIQKLGIPGGYECRYIAAYLSDGDHSLILNAQDYEGNSAAQVASVFTIDNAAPDLALNEPLDELITNKNTIAISGVANDATGVVVVCVYLNGVLERNLQVGENGEFNTTINLQEGKNKIVVVARDKAGNETKVSREVFLDTFAPIITDVCLSANPVSTGDELLITVFVVD